LPDGRDGRALWAGIITACCRALAIMDKVEMTLNTTARVKEPEPEQHPAEMPAVAPPQPEHRNDEDDKSKRPRGPSHRRRALLFLSAIGLLLAGWWGSGYVFAYTDDAYLTSDLVSITSEVTGPVVAVHVTDNQWVERGTELFMIDPVPFKLALDQAKAMEAQAEAQLPIDQSELDNLRAQKESADSAATLAVDNLARDTPLAQSGYLSAQSLERSRTAKEQSVAEQRALQAAVQRATDTLSLHQVAVASARAARQLAEWRLSRTKVIAPVDGHITHLTLQTGDMAMTSRAAVAIVDANAWRVMANYKEYYLRHLSPGHEAWIWLDTHPWHFYRARIQGLARGISRVQGAEELVPYVSPTVDWIRLQRRIPVRLTLLDDPGKDQLFMGADARVLVIY
jgi:membrane fusion protein, multidrug efflux system